MLQTNFNEQDYQTALSNAQAWRYVAPIDDRDAWSRVRAENPTFADNILEHAAAMQDQPWPELTDELYAEFSINGNRTRFEKPYFERRRLLTLFCVASCLSGKLIYERQIIDGFQLIINENIWTLPAHNTAKARGAFPPGTQMVDLFVGETGMTLTTLWFMMRDALAVTYSEMESQIKHAVEERLLLPVEEGTPYWWLQGSNNWGPWCASNTLMCAMNWWAGEDRLPRMAYYLSQTIDNFIGHYHDDGGCDEGPGYWSKAAGAMFAFLDCLYVASEGRISIFDQEKVNKMGQFIRVAHLCQDRFINFADATSKMLPSPGLIYKYGKRCQDANLQSFAHDIFSLRQRINKEQGFKPKYVHIDSIAQLCWYEQPTQNAKPSVPLCDYLNGIEVFVAREQSAKERGFIIAAKGGHNHESHNHNDIGHFMLYHNAQPIIIDVGVGEYTADTFNENRYTIWPINALSHNAPIINGVHQQAGRAYAAHAADCQHDERHSVFSLDLSTAYPAALQGTKVHRRIHLERGDLASVTIQDQVSADDAITSFTITLVSPLLPSIEHDQVAFAGTPVQMQFNAELFEVRIREQTIDDPKLKISWGDILYVIDLEAKVPTQSILSSLHFALGKS